MCAYVHICTNIHANIELQMYIFRSLKTKTIDLAEDAVCVEFTIYHHYIDNYSEIRRGF